MSADPTKGAPEPTVPYPPRFWWLTRLTALGCALAVVALVVRWWWGATAQNRLDETVAAARVRGDPILVLDYIAESHPPDESNAAVYLRRAAMALKLTRTEEWALENVEALPVPEDVAPIAAAVVRRYRPQLAEVIEARRDPNTIDWAVPIRSPMWNVLLRDLNHVGTLRELARAAALLAAQDADYATALEQLRNLQFIANSPRTQPFRVAQQFMIHSRNSALSALQAIAVDAPMDDAEVREEFRRPELLDERWQLEALQQGAAATAPCTSTPDTRYSDRR